MSDTASFGESHASELSSISSDHVHLQSHAPLTPPPQGAVVLPPVAQDAPAPNQSKAADPIDPQTLNQTPTILPSMSAGAVPGPAADEGRTDPAPPIPTIADTGVPVSGGPGPASGSLLELRAQRTSTQSQSALGSSTVAAESAEDEKKRLAREEEQRTLAIQPPAPAQPTGGDVQPSTAAAVPPPTISTSTFESADDEKRRLEREERERILRQGGQQSGQGEEQADAPREEDLPPYQPI